MSTLTDRLMADTRIVPIRRQNRIKTVTKLEGGSMLVTTHSGQTYTIAADDETLQAFAVYTVLAELAD